MAALLNRDPVVEGETPIVSLEPPRQRRVSLMVLGGLVVVIAALVAAWVVASAGETHRVVVAGGDLAPGHVMTAGDLRIVELGGSLDVPSIDANSQELVIGRAVASKVPAGTVLNEAMFIDADQVIPPGMVIVGAVLEDGQVPLGSIGPGEPVSLISTIDADSGEPAVLIGNGVIYRIQASENGGHWVSVMVPADIELAVASAAAADELRLGRVTE